jgi:hypothetical protein
MPISGQYYAMKAFLTWELDGGEWSASCSCHFTPRERAPDTHWIGDWVGPRASLDAVEKRNILHCQESNHSTCIPSLCRLRYQGSSPHPMKLKRNKRNIIHALYVILKINRNFYTNFSFNIQYLLFYVPSKDQILEVKLYDQCGCRYYLLI